MNEHSSGTRATVPPSATQSGTWISVDERLPEIDDIVIGFWNPSAGVIPSCYGITKYAGYWCNPDDPDVAYGVPSHWMPLPNPPANWKTRPLLQEMDTGTDSTRSGDQINPEGVAAPDQGSVRNATDMERELVELRQTLKDECQLAADEEKRLKAQIKFLTDGESEVFAARAEVSRLRQDAQRYQQARTMQLHVYGDDDPHGAYIYHSGTSLDAVVDAAIRALPDQKD